METKLTTRKEVLLFINNMMSNSFIKPTNLSFNVDMTNEEFYIAIEQAKAYLVSGNKFSEIVEGYEINYRNTLK